MSAAGRPSVVFFDVGDTLLRVDPSWSAIYLRACREYGFEVVPEAVDAAFRAVAEAGSIDGTGPYEPTAEASYQRVKAFDERMMAILGHSELPDRFYRRVGELFRAAEAWHVFPEVRGVLDRISEAGIRCTVISNWVWGLPELLHDLDLAGHFEHVVVSARVGYEKPNPGIFRHALALTGVPGSQAVHVGDNPAADVSGARSVGIRPILIRRRPEEDPAVLAGPAFADVPVIRDLTGLPALIGLAGEGAAPGVRAGTGAA